jgi:DNA-binding transcriptional MerR regulator
VPQNKPSTFDKVSIGDVSRATDISVYTLRMWERRYGTPHSTKLPSGHRRYGQDEIERLKLVKILLDHKFKVSKIINLSTFELKDKVSKIDSPDLMDLNKVNLLIDYSDKWNDSILLKSFEDDWAGLGYLNFLKNRAAKLLNAVGDQWESGALSVAKEHFISESLESFIRSKWSEKNKELEGNPVIVCSLEGESHKFGIHFTSTICAFSNLKVLYLGGSVPTSELLNTSSRVNPKFICISISSNYPIERSIKELTTIRKHLPREIKIITGGAGAPTNIDGILNFDNLDLFHRWVTIMANPSLRF